MAKKGNFNAPKLIAKRFLKFAPGVACLIAVEFLWPLVGSGPIFTYIADKQSQICANNWWRNVFFITNWHDVRENCVTHTFWSAIDMQLFLLGLIAVALTVRNVKWGIAFAVTLSVLDLVIDVYLTHVHDLRATLAAYPADVG